MADFPGNLASDGSLLISANNVSSTLNGGLSAAATDATLASTTHFPAKGGITVESEAILYTGNNTATSVLSGLTRGADSTTAVIHANGTSVFMHMQARHHNSIKDEVIAIETNIANRFGNTTTGVTVAQVFGTSTTFNGTMTAQTTTVFNGPTTLNTTTTINGPMTFNTTTTWNTTTSIKGTGTNNNAASGYVGEYIESLNTATTNAAATTQWNDVATLSITAGDWNIDLCGFMEANGATISEINVGIGTVSGNDATGLILGSNRASVTIATSSTAMPDLTLSISGYRASVAASTTYYFKQMWRYTAGGPPRARGRISSRRIR